MGLFSVIGSIIGGGKAASAGDKAAQLQYDAAEMGIDESRRQFDLTREDFAGYQSAGNNAIGGLAELLGLSGGDQQLAAITSLRESPLFQQLYNTGEESILANASATGGLRGGNSQRSLYDLGEGTLSSVIQQQISNLGGVAGIGAGAANSVGAFGANAVNSQNDLRNQGAAAQAGAALNRGGIAAQNWNNVGSSLDGLLGSLFGGGGF